MVDRLLLQNAAAYDEMTFTLPGGALDTTVTTSDLTLQFTKSGASYTTTGISFTANTNAGTLNLVYDTTSFVTSTGDYYLLVIHGTKDYHKYYAHYNVAPAQTYTAVAASFTPSSGDGRVTDGTNPIDGATVYVKLSSGTVITQVESDSNGLYDTIYGLTESATLYVQKSGYDQGTGSITVAGLTATGPGTDIALSTSTANDFLVSNLITYCRQMAGADMTGDRFDTVAIRCINVANNMVAMDTNSEYFRDQSGINVTAPYQTGELSCSQDSATISISSGVWPTWTETEGYLEASSHLYRPTAVAANSLDATVSTNWVDSTQTIASGSWTLHHPSYALPDNWLRTRYIVFGSSTLNGEQDFIPIEDFLAKMYEEIRTSSQPDQWSIADDKIWFYPIPSARMAVELVGTRRPTQVVNSSETLDCCHSLKNILYRAIDLQLAISYGKIEGDRSVKDCLDAYQMALFLATRNDKNGPIIQPPSFADPKQFGITVAMHNAAPDP